MEAAGAEVKQTKDGKLRVQGVIQVTRCLGDRQLRRHGLISEPEIQIHQIGPSDNAIVMASDGLWDVLTPARVNFCMRNTAKSPDSASPPRPQCHELHLCVCVTRVRPSKEHTF